MFNQLVVRENRLFSLDADFFSIDFFSFVHFTFQMSVGVTGNGAIDELEWKISHFFAATSRALR